MAKKAKTKSKGATVIDVDEQRDRRLMQMFRRQERRQRDIRALAKRVLRERDKTQQALRSLATEIDFRLKSHEPAGA